jgi:putative hemolysin
VFINAFFAASEIALISLNDNKIKVMAAEGNKKAKKLKKILSEPTKFLSTIQIGITLAGFFASALAADRFSGSLVKLLQLIPISLSASILKPISVILITLVLSYFTLVFGELVPKRLAMKKAEAIAFFAVTPLHLLSVASSPFVRLLTTSTNFLVRLFGVDPHAEDDHVTEEEIRMMVDVGEEKGTIDEDERVMINNIFEFDNKVVSECMTPRTAIVGIPANADLATISTIIQEEQYTRFPIFEENMDNIIGVLHVKDLLPFIQGGKVAAFQLNKLIRKPYFVPESKRTDDLFKELQRSKNHMAIVIDEYGGTAGLVTIEDLLEQIVGHIFDEYDDVHHDYEQLDPHTYRIKGDYSLSLVEDLLETNLPTEDYETLSGFLIGQLGRIPEAGEKPIVEFGSVVFKIEAIEEKRIIIVKAYHTKEV